MSSILVVAVALFSGVAFAQGRGCSGGEGGGKQKQQEGKQQQGQGQAQGQAKDQATREQTGQARASFGNEGISVPDLETSAGGKDSGGSRAASTPVSVPAPPAPIYQTASTEVKIAQEVVRGIGGSTVPTGSLAALYSGKHWETTVVGGTSSVPSDKSEGEAAEKLSERIYSYSAGGTNSQTSTVQGQDARARLLARPAPARSAFVTYDAKRESRSVVRPDITLRATSNTLSYVESPSANGSGHRGQ